LQFQTCKSIISIDPILPTNEGLQRAEHVLQLKNTYVPDICVACEDFRTTDTDNIEFQEIMRTIYDPGELKKIARLEQIYATYNLKKF